MKRKELEEGCDEFMDFSLSSPARKIRRLDASELPPTMGLVETASAMTFDDPVSCVSDIVMPSWESVHEDNSPPYPSYNEERAIVLYKPVESPLFMSPGSTDLSLRVASHFIPCLKNHVLNTGNQRLHAEEEETEADSSSLAIVPWAPSQAAMAFSEFAHEPMEAEDAEVTSMQVEDTRQATGYSEGGEGFQQVPQHCMTPQLLPSLFTC
ncbi:uncharacterized protein LOC121998490 [Zingiber officinale]|uniref:Uncharacterized protein n=1 Tax=Zingiber officinale TaxID=94328 RepID=A0A8J5GIF0_ZINOF|nr:uncharacterized protein LOC121998490 [Zingiber officinale]KAG6502078.1 hypothetical protein ZIOFF_041965 [Zingiber officinale]